MKLLKKHEQLIWIGIITVITFIFINLVTEYVEFMRVGEYY